MHNGRRVIYVALAVSAAAAVACSSTSSPKKSPEGGLWVANNEADTLPDFSTNQLATSGNVEPAVRLVTKVGGAAGLALDGSGNMWWSSYYSDTLLMYSPAARNAGGHTAPTNLIISTAFVSPENLTFDSHGNLWVADCGGKLLAFSPAQQTAGGTQTPTIVITGAATTLGCPFSIAFDGSGNAWVADIDRNVVVKFSAASLAASGAPAPATTISSNAGSLNSTDAVVFDTHGNLWVGNDGLSTVVAYTPAQLAAGGTPVPNVTITLPNTAEPYGLAFDNQGTLWVSDYSNDLMLGLSSSQQSATGSPTPSVTLTATLADLLPQQPLYDPHATAKGVAALRVGSGHIAASSVRSLHQNRHQR
jgi:sugar lactone lactonase YvrE